MQNTLCAGRAIRLAAFYFTLAGLCQAVHAQPEVRFRLVHDTAIVVSVMANDQGPFDFLLDTGTSTTIVDPSLARRLSLTSSDRIDVITLAAVRSLARSSMLTLALGPVRVQNPEVVIENLDDAHELDPHIEGIMGQNFLSHFNYLLDYRKRSIRFERASEIEDALCGDRVPVDVSENTMVVASEASSRGRAKLRLLLDSGVNSVVLIRKFSRILDFGTEQSWIDSDGEVGPLIDRLRLLTVGSQKLHDIAVALAPDVPRTEERIEDGLLPTSLFRSVYVNNREHFVVLNPEAKKN